MSVEFRTSLIVPAPNAPDADKGDGAVRLSAIDNRLGGSLPQGRSARCGVACRSGSSDTTSDWHRTRANERAQ